MRRTDVATLFAGAALALGCLLFPAWEWTQDEGDIAITGRSVRSSVFAPPVPSARVDVVATLLPVGAVAVLTAGALLACRSRRSEGEAATFWRAKWEHIDSSGDTLLRAAEEPSVPPKTLLRPAEACAASRPEEMLRAGRAARGEE